MGGRAAIVLTCLAVAALLWSLPAAAGGVAVVGTVVTDNGDGDGFADTQETVTLQLVVRNTSGADLTGLTARLSTSDGLLACLTRPLISIGDLAAGEERTTADAFEFVVPPGVERATQSDDLFARFTLSIMESPPEELSTTPWIELDMDLDVSGGSGPTVFFEGFEEGFGAFTTMHLDESLNPPDSDLANRSAGMINADGHRCQYSDPDWEGNESCLGASCPEQCFPSPNGAPDAFYFGIVTDRAFTGLQSMGYNMFLDEARGYTTPNSQLEAIASGEPVNLAWEVACSVSGSACTDDIDCPIGETCDPAAPRLSFKHQISLLDHRSVATQPERTADRAVLGVQLAAADGGPIGDWVKVYPYVNVYDSMGNSNYFNCSFDPADDGNDEGDFFDPADPNRSQGPSSTCAPEFTFAHQGDTDDPYDPLNVGDADAGAGLAGELGAGTWVEPEVDLGRYRGRRIRIRFLETGLKLGGAVNWEQAFDFNPDPGDDGWFIDDVTVTAALTVPATVLPDHKDNSGLPFDLGGDGESDGVFDVCDNCPATVNPGQGDIDGDGLGDACDVCPSDPDDDIDSDGRCVLDDNCPIVANPDQFDTDGDDSGDACDTCPLESNPGQSRDTDMDGIDCPMDNCPDEPNPDQADDDGDGIGDLCDACLGDATGDGDGDGVCGLSDNCPQTANPAQGPALELTPLQTEFRLSPDESTLVIRLGDSYDAAVEGPLYSLPAIGGDPVELASMVAEGFLVTPDSSTVIFEGANMLFRVPIAGGPVEQLGAELGALSIIDFRLGPDGDRVFFKALISNAPFTRGIFSVAIGGGVSTRHGDLSAGRIDYRVSPDGTELLILRDPDGAFPVEFKELCSVPIDGGPVIDLTPGLVAGGQILAAEFAPDGGRIVYVADQDVYLVRELYSVPTDGSAAPVKLNGPMVTHGDIGGDWGADPPFTISEGGNAVVYVADQDTNSTDELYRVPIAGGPVTKLNAPLGFAAVQNYQLTPDGARVVYVVNSRSTVTPWELFVVPVAGGAALRLYETLESEQIDPFQVTPDSAHVVFRRTRAGETLMSVPIGGGAAVALSDTHSQIARDFVLGNDSTSALYSATGSLVRWAPVAGGTPIDLSGGTGSGPPLAWADSASIAYFRGPGDGLFGAWLDHDPDADGIHTACDCDGAAAALPPFPEFNDGLDNQCPDQSGSGLIDELDGQAGFTDPMDPALYVWSGQPGATRYEVVRAGDPGFGSECACSLTSLTRLRIAEQPPSGTAYFYLPRAAAPHRGSVGRDGSGVERSGACLAFACEFGGL